MKHDNLNEFMHDGWSYSKNFGFGSVSVSKETGNIIQQTPDGLFAPKTVITSNEEPTDENVILWINPDAANEDEDLLSNAIDERIGNYLTENPIDATEQINELLDEKNVIYTIEVDGKNLVNQNDENFVVGHLLSSGSIASSVTNYRTTGYIFVPSGKSVTCSSRVRQFLAYTLEKTPITESFVNVPTTNHTYTATEDCYIRATLFLADIDIFQIEYGTVPTDYAPYQKEYTFDDNVKNAILNISKDSQDLSSGNVLYGKKWAVCGDSFSNGDFSNALDTDYVIKDGIYRGNNKVYGYLIGNRNNMIIQHLALGGRTMGLPSDHETTGFTNSFINYYQSIDEDVDYITLYLGINDEHHLNGDSGSDGEDVTGVIPIGTLDDTTTDTFCGAYQVVLDWLIVNRPNAKIGIIVTNGITSTTEYREKTIAIAKKYGIPYIDLNGDERTPAMHRTCNGNIATSVKRALIAKWSVNPSSNTHPSAKAHEYESVIIENFLRSL